MSDDYKRQVDLWVKLSVLVTPLISGGVMWGVNKTTMQNFDGRLTKAEAWIASQTQSMIETAKANGKSAEQQEEMNRRLERIEVILDSRLQRH